MAGFLDLRARLRPSWLIALVVTIPFAAGLFVVIKDLQTTDAVFANGVVQAQRFVSTGNQADAAGTNLPVALSAVDAGSPQVASLITTLGTAQAAAAAFASSASQLGSILSSAAPPLSGVLNSVDTVNQRATQVGASLTSILRSLASASQGITTLSNNLTQTLARARAIEAKVHALRTLSGA